MSKAAAIRRLLVLCAALLAASAQAAEFHVTSELDAVDVAPGDGACADASGGCTLRAAVMETNALAGDDVVYAPAGSYQLVAGSGAALFLSGNLAIVGAGADRTAIVTSRDVAFFVTETGRLSIRGLRVTAATVALWVGFESEVEVLRSAITDTPIGIYVSGGSLRVVESTMARNGGVAGPAGAGALVLSEGSATLINSTVSGYTSCDPYYGCSAIANYGGSVFIVNSTVAGYIGDPIYGGAIYGPVTLARTVLANEINCSGPGLSPTSLGHNIASDGSCNLVDPTDLPNTDPLLGPLQANGGTTDTHALLPGSPAVDAIPVADCTSDDDGDPGTPEVPLATDQRGVARPYGAGCDIGAFEVPAPAAALLSSVAALGLAAVRQLRKLW